MEASTTIKQMMAGNEISIPNYQRAYSWAKDDQVKTFLEDLEDYNKSSSKSNYYFGHFLFEEKGPNKFGVIDGQQRMTTIVIFLSALFKRLKDIRELKEKEGQYFEDIIKRGSTYRFETVGYDDRLFKDYVIDQTKKDKNRLETESAKRIVAAFDFFTSELKDKEEEYLVKMLDTVQKAQCTTHQVKNESEAIQMFIFQNNRGKKPSNLEIIKAQFMFNVHLHGGEEKENLIDEIKDRFEKIYKNISSIEHKINEDDVLGYTLRVHFNSLLEANNLDKINESLSEGKGSIPFIRSFTQSLEGSFDNLTAFFGEEGEKKHIEIHSLVTLGEIGIAMPFIIKAYKFGLPINQINQLCKALESMLLRQRLIGTNAKIASRLNDVYQGFTEEEPEIQPIIGRIEWMKNEYSYYWAHWNTEKLKANIQGGIHWPTAKYLLWKYENHLGGQGKGGYKPIRFDDLLENPELEHIAPQTENPEAGYDSYDDDFTEQYLHCLGNYLLVPESHNRSIGNKPFKDKRDSYTQLAQQREIREMTKDDLKWTKEKIAERKEKIVRFILDKLS